MKGKLTFISIVPLLASTTATSDEPCEVNGGQKPVFSARVVEAIFPISQNIVMSTFVPSFLMKGILQPTLDIRTILAQRSQTTTLRVEGESKQVIIRLVATGMRTVEDKVTT